MKNAVQGTAFILACVFQKHWQKAPYFSAGWLACSNARLEQQGSSATELRSCITTAQRRKEP